MWKIFVLYLTIFFKTSYCSTSVACSAGISPTTASGPQAPKGVICSGDLILDENFDTLNYNLWKHDITLSGGGNWEFEWYTNNRSISFVEDNLFHIRPHLTSELYGDIGLSTILLDVNGEGPGIECTDARDYGCMRQGTPTNILNPIRSAKLSTAETISFKYGRVEIVAKLPKGDWLWPAFWMLPRYNVYGGWPASGEIDIMESRGNVNYMLNGVNIGTQQVGSTLHWGPDYWHNANAKTHFTYNDPSDFTTKFTTFGLYWTTSNITFYVDNTITGVVQPPQDFWSFGDFDVTDNPWQYSNSNLAPFDQEFYLIFNVAVGGTSGFFPADATENGVCNKPWDDTSSMASLQFWNARKATLPTWNLNSPTNCADFQIASVKVWAL